MVYQTIKSGPPVDVQMQRASRPLVTAAADCGSLRGKKNPGERPMRMFQVCTCGEPLQLNEAPTPEPKGSEVLLKVLAAGVCHSDLHLADGYFDLGGGKRLSLQDRGMKLPVTLGHENVGEVVAAGPDAKGVKAGQKMLANPWIGCGVCAVCQRGEDNLCRAMRSLGVFTNGGYATHMIVPHPRYLHDIGDLDPARAAPLACSGATTYGALKKVATLKSEPTVIIGAGGLGLMCLALNQKMGGHRRSWSTSIQSSATRPRRPAPLTWWTARRPTPCSSSWQLTGGAAWAVIDLVGSSQSARLGYRLAHQRRQIHHRRALSAAISRCRCRRSRCARSPSRAPMSAISRK